jgi:hypothetical protein
MSTLRWTLFIPSAAVIHFIVSTLFYNLQHVFDAFGPVFIFSRVGLATFCGFTVGRCVAPRTRIAPHIMLGLYLLLFVAVIIQLAVTAESRVRWVAGGIEAVALLVGAVLGFRVWRCTNDVS